MPFVIAIETSSDACSVALHCADGVTHRHSEEARMHARTLLPMIDSLLRERGLTPSALDAVAFGAGPGSFTGLRIAAASAQALAWAHDLPVVPVSSLHVLAATALARQTRSVPGVVCAVDARMGEFYLGRYRAVPDAPGGCDAAANDLLVAADGEAIGSHLQQTEDWLYVGDAAQRVCDWMGCAGAACVDVLPDARSLLDIALARLERGETTDARGATPVYLRGASAWRRLGEPVPG